MTPLEQLPLPLWEPTPAPDDEGFWWWLLRGLRLIVLATVGSMVLPVLVHLGLALVLFPVMLLVMWLAGTL